MRFSLISALLFLGAAEATQGDDTKATNASQASTEATTEDSSKFFPGMFHSPYGYGMGFHGMYPFMGAGFGMGIHPFMHPFGFGGYGMHPFMHPFGGFGMPYHPMGMMGMGFHGYGYGMHPWGYHPFSMMGMPWMMGGMYHPMGMMGIGIHPGMFAA